MCMIVRIAVMPFNLCELCGNRHHIAHRCPLYRLNAAHWVNADDSSSWLWHVPVHELTEFDVICPHCHARSWRGETINCCGSGRLQLPIGDDVPSEVSEIILSAHVRQHIRRFVIAIMLVSYLILRRYNMSFAMASVGHNNRSLPDSTFIMGGRSYHRIGDIRPRDAEHAAFAQIYMLDADEAADRRMAVVGGSDTESPLRRAVLQLLHELLLRHNPWVQRLRAAVAHDTPVIEWHSDIDVSGMVIGAVVASPGSRSIVMRQQSDQLPQFIHDGHSLYHTLAYPLLFPTGATGWHDRMYVWDSHRGREHRVTLLEWSRHLLMHRTSPTFLQRCERLSLEFYCDLYAQYEAQVAAFHSLPRQQAKYRCASYRAVHDELHRDGHDRASLSSLGRPMILPSSFVGSPRYYHQLYLDAMALPHRFHKPDLFITITCNPCWPEISRAIPAGSHWRFHPDIVGRVFMLKFQSILQEITVSEIFGRVLAFVWRVEWQVLCTVSFFVICCVTSAVGERVTPCPYVGYISRASNDSE